MQGPAEGRRHAWGPASKSPLVGYLGASGRRERGRCLEAVNAAALICKAVVESLVRMA